MIDCFNIGILAAAGAVGAIMANDATAQEQVIINYLSKSAKEAQTKLWNGQIFAPEHILVAVYQRHKKLSSLPKSKQRALSSGVTSSNVRLSHNDISTYLMEVLRLKLNKFMKSLQNSFYPNVTAQKKWALEQLAELMDYVAYWDHSWKEYADYTAASRFVKLANHEVRKMKASKA